MNDGIIKKTKNILQKIDNFINWRTRKTKDKTGFYIYKFKNHLGAYFRFTDIEKMTDEYFTEYLKSVFDYDFDSYILYYTI